jgi:hypothetical protein
MAVMKQAVEHRADSGGIPQKECLGIEVAEFLGRYHGCHDWPPFQRSSNAQQAIPMMKDEWMRKKAKNNIRCAGKTAIRLMAVMIPPLVTEVNPSHVADFAPFHDYSERGNDKLSLGWELGRRRP